MSDTGQNSAKKFDTGKAPMSLIPSDALDEIAKVLDFGKKKYAAHNWRKGMEWSRLIDATLRHVNAWKEGEEKDAESGLSHLAHAACCITFLLSFEKRGAGTDDRYKHERT